MSKLPGPPAAQSLAAHATVRPRSVSSVPGGQTPSPSPCAVPVPACRRNARHAGGHVSDRSAQHRTCMRRTTPAPTPAMCTYARPAGEEEARTSTRSAPAAWCVLCHPCMHIAWHAGMHARCPPRPRERRSELQRILASSSWWPPAPRAPARMCARVRIDARSCASGASCARCRDRVVCRNQ